MVTGADGTERTVYWRAYPGVAGIDPRQVLEGPTPQEGHDAGQAMVAEIKAALSEEFQLEWAPLGTEVGSSPFHRPIENGYGGESLLTNVNGPESQSTTVPQAWEEKQRAIGIIGEVARRYGYEAPAINGLENWSAEDRIRDLGGLTPDRQVIVSGVAPGPGRSVAVLQVPGSFKGHQRRLRGAAPAARRITMADEYAGVELRG